MNCLVYLTWLSFMQNRKETHNIKIACPQLHIGRDTLRVKTEPRSFSYISLFHQTLVSHFLDGNETILTKSRYPEFTFNTFTAYYRPFCSGIFFFTNTTLSAVQVLGFYFGFFVLFSFFVFPFPLPSF